MAQRGWDGDTGTKGYRDTGTKGYRDTGPCSEVGTGVQVCTEPGDRDTQVGTARLGWGYGYMGTWGHGNMGTQGHRSTQRGRDPCRARLRWEDLEDPEDPEL